MTRILSIVSDSTLTTAQVHSTRHFGGWALIAIGAAIWILWPIVAIKNWQNVIESHARLGYLIGDMVLVAPLCIASGYGTIEDLRWGPPVLLLAVGAAAYDLTHFLIFLAQIGFPKIKGKRLPVAVYPVLIIVVLALLGWIAWREIRIEISPPNALIGFAPQGGGLYVWLGAMLGGAVACGLLVWRHGRTTPAVVESSPPEP